MLNNKSILITGGSGYFGQCFIETVFRDYPKVKRIVVYSRDPLKHEEIKQRFPEKQYPQLRFFIGDVRDLERLQQACENIDILIHSATLSSLEASEYNPEECIKTNIMGAENVIKASLMNKVRDVIALSSDKASSPVSLYGATQLVADKLFVAANNMIGSKDIRFSVIRFGNVLELKNSVIARLLRKRSIGGNTLQITDKRMTRFIISIQQVIASVIFAIENHLGGEIFVPKSSSYKLPDLATAIVPDMEQEETGIRPGEKLHEELISEAEGSNTMDIGSQYIIVPSITFTGNRTKDHYVNHYTGNLVNQCFKYRSNENIDVETLSSLREKINQLIKHNIK